MAYMQTVAPTWDRAVLATLRSYAGARGAGVPLLPALIRTAEQGGWSAHVAIALGSVFDLTEALLERMLQVSGTDDAAMGEDERAMLLMLRHGGDLAPGQGDAAIPHGLPGALVWAIRSARLVWKGLDGSARVRAAPEGRRCPFPNLPAGAR